MTPTSGQCLASAANDKVVVTYIKGDVYDTAEINAGVSVSKRLIQGCTIVVLIQKNTINKAALEQNNVFIGQKYVGH